MCGILCCFLWWVVESRRVGIERIRDNLIARVAIVGVVDVGVGFVGVEVEVGVSVGLAVGVGVGIAIGVSVEARIQVCIYLERPGIESQFSSQNGHIPLCRTRTTYRVG